MDNQNKFKVLVRLNDQELNNKHKVLNCLQGHVTFDDNGNRKTLVQITQNRSKLRRK